MTNHERSAYAAAPISTNLRLALIGGTALVSSLLMAGSVQAQADLTTTQATQLQRLTVTATRNASKVLDVPMTVSVITAEDLNKRVVRDIQDLVRYEPGVSVTRQTAITNPFGQLTGFTIRGMGGNRVQMLVDGARIQEQVIDGSRDFVDPFNLKTVEIVRGPNSVLWGADALGGVVAFQTKDPSDILQGMDKPWGVEIKTAFDSFDNSWRKQITAAYDFGDVEILGSFGNLTSTEAKAIKGDPEGGIWGCPIRPAYFRCNQLYPADTNAYNGLVKVVWTPNADHEIKLTGEFFDRNTVVQQIWDSGAVATGIPTALGYVSNAYPRTLDMERYRFAISHDWQVGADWLDSVKWNFSYSPQARRMDSTSYRTYSNRRTTVQSIRDYSENFWEADVQLQSSFELGETDHTLTYGFDGDFMRGDYTSSTATWDSRTGLTTTVVGNTGFSFPRTETIRADFFVQDEIKLLDDRLTITPGARLATYHIDPTVDPTYTGLPGYAPAPISSVELLKKLSVTYELDDNYSVYAAYGEGFKMPNAQQLFQSSTNLFTAPPSTIVPNPDLKPEAVKNYEVGVRGEFDNGWFSAGAFYSNYDNFIRSLQEVPGKPNHYWSNNVEEVHLWGIELGGEYEFYENIYATANVSWQRGVQRISSGAAETGFDGAVPLTAVLGLRYEIPEHGLEFEVMGTFAAGQGERALPTTFKSEGYAVFDAFGTWKPSENVEINFGVQNIFDTAYFPNTISNYSTVPGSPDVAAQNPLELQRGPGRTFKIGTTVRF